MRRRNSEAEVEQSKKRIATNGHRLPDPIGIGEILTDVTKTQWKIGNSIGVGGFGEIYLASDDISKPVGSESKYVIKVEPHDNGPLFVEMNFYIRAAKSELIDKWKKHCNLKQLGMPCFIGSGSHMYRGMRYRFLVLERFGEDLSKLFLRNRKQFHIKTVLTLAIQILDILEFIHNRGYIHADIKASNLLLGRKNDKNQVYLLDYGLACHYLETNGMHKAYDSDERRAHKGTIEFTSRDAHIGASSRRGDVEVLGYNILQWLCGKLPWEKHTEVPELVHEQKVAYMTNIPELLRACFLKSQAPPVLTSYLKYVANLEFDAKPDYAYCKKLFRQGIKDAGYVDDGYLEFDDPDSIPRARKVKKISGKRSANEDPENISPKRQLMSLNVAPRLPCEAHNFNRMTRNSRVTSRLLGLNVDSGWEKVISGDPDWQLKKKAQPGNPDWQLKKKAQPRSPARLVKCDKDLTTPAYIQQKQVGVKVLTPAMVDVMARQWKQVGMRSGCKKSKRESSSPLRMQNGYPTPEMLRVMQRRKQLSLLEKTKNCDVVKSVSPVLVLRSGKERLNTPILKKLGKKTIKKASRKTSSSITRKVAIQKKVHPRRR